MSIIIGQKCFMIINNIFCLDLHDSNIISVGVGVWREVKKDQMHDDGLIKS
jgi:hypothetical protein